MVAGLQGEGRSGRGEKGGREGGGGGCDLVAMADEPRVSGFEGLRFFEGFWEKGSTPRA